MVRETSPGVGCMLTAVLCGAALASGQPATAPASQAALRSWPLWGGVPQRNAVAPRAIIPTSWDVERGENVLWVVQLGSYSYGGPVVADGRVYVGTNNAAELRPHSQGDKGCVVCVDAASGALLWQATHDKLPSGSINDWPEQGVASTPCVDGDRVYYVSNRAELVCADAAGFHDGENDGPYQAERFTERQDADFVWVLDMFSDLQVFPHNLAASSPLVVGDLVFVCTGNAVDDEGRVPHPEAPSFLAVDKRTGKLVWKRNDPGRDILHGQWSSPAYGVIGGRPQVIFGGGDGWCYAFEPEAGKPLWRFNLNPPGSEWKQGGYGTKTSIVATPVVHNDRVLLAVGDDPEAAAGPGHLYAIDATQRGDISTSGRVWHVGGEAFGRTLSSVAVADGLVYAADLNGFLYCFDEQTGKQHWKHDMWAGVWASPCVLGACVLLGNADGELVMMQHSRTLKELGRVDMLHSIYTPPAAVEGTLYVLTQRRLYAIGATDNNRQ